jgi:chromate reductase, NAD(P)H dehydrogenase (quinone)
MPRILVFSGSIRAGSNNQKLADLAANFLRKEGADVRALSLADYPLPFADADGFASQPEEAKALFAQIDAHDGCFIAAPEYNSGITPLLKNALDWASMAAKRPPFRNKILAIGCASGGAWGGHKSLPGLRHILEVGLGAMVIPEMASIPGGVWNDDGSIKDEGAARLVEAAAKRLVAELQLRSNR